MINWKGCGSKEVLFWHLPGTPKETTENVKNTE
jgi:hypothetical protein